MGDAEQFIARIENSMAGIAAAEWDACAGADNIFACHAFLSALEDSASATPETGWAPHHILLEGPAGGIIGAMPLYLKSHSYGEYVFDHSWAHAYEQAGGRYYPKLQSSVPFTPATGQRFLVRDGCEPTQVQTGLAAAAIQLAERAGVSSLHVTFTTEDEWNLLGRAGFLQRKDQQFHWCNRDYSTFDDFLADLSSRKRKAIRKERRQALASDITIHNLTGADITEAHWDVFFEFYLDTGARKWGQPYLTREFFSLLGERLSDACLLILCERDGQFIAGALNLIGGDTLFGRYWGCSEHHRFLHFEVCYYQAIDYAIKHGLARVEAGAQGSHKLARGYLPQITYSAHWIADPNFRRAIAQYLDDERHHVDAEARLLAGYGPFRQNDGR